jgi:hypothetical protein
VSHVSCRHKTQDAESIFWQVKIREALSEQRGTDEEIHLNSLIGNPPFAVAEMMNSIWKS